MTTQQTLLAISEKAEQIRQSSESLLNAPARDAAIQITVMSGRLQVMHSTIIEALRHIGNAHPNASADEMRLMANAALMSINE